MECIAAVSREWALGKDNALLFSLREDMKYFRQMTAGKTLVMGRRTLDSFPGGKPLPKRVNLVLTRDPAFFREGAETVPGIDALQARLKGEAEENVMVIGGAQIYKTLLPLCTKAYITKVEASRPDADAFFPDLDADPAWTCVCQSQPLEENGLTFRFCTYEKNGG